MLARVESPGDLALVRTFYVTPNTQSTMADTFTAGTPLAQVFADRIAAGLTARGLTQAPPDMADATVTFQVNEPSAAAPDESGNTQSLSYADQLLNEAKALDSDNSFLQSSQVDFRIKVLSGKTRQVLWRGSVAGVLSASEGNRGRLLDVMDAVDRVLEQYPKVK